MVEGTPEVEVEPEAEVVEGGLDDVMVMTTEEIVLGNSADFRSGFYVLTKQQPRFFPGRRAGNHVIFFRKVSIDFKEEALEAVLP